MFGAAMAAALIAAGGAAGAATVTGVAVGAVGSSTQVGKTEPRAAMGGTQAIRYYIPLGGSDCIYGVSGCGTSPDTGKRGPTMTMILRFDPVSTTSPSALTVNFEDLDLSGANDPRHFLETLEVLDAGGTSLTGKITDIDNSPVTGDADTQHLSAFSLGTLDQSPLFLQLTFTADSFFSGTNTAEYLTATVTAVPVPAAGIMLLTALGGLGGAGALRRRRKAG